MLFEKVLMPADGAVLRALGYKTQPPDAVTAGFLQAATARLETVAQPRWTYKRFSLEEGQTLAGAALQLPGRDMAAHLAGCTACFLLGLTLGAELDRNIRAAEVETMGYAVVLDTAASLLVEQYADEAQRLLARVASKTGEYVTGRFSPGYGDLPLALQGEMVRLMDAPRQIGLSVNQSGSMVPRKSITAVLGVAGHPVQGKQAGCDSCALAKDCKRRKGGEYCGKNIG